MLHSCKILLAGVLLVAGCEADTIERYPYHTHDDDDDDGLDFDWDVDGDVDVDLEADADLNVDVDVDVNADFDIASRIGDALDRVTDATRGTITISNDPNRGYYTTPTSRPSATLRPRTPRPTTRPTRTTRPTPGDVQKPDRVVRDPRDRARDRRTRDRRTRDRGNTGSVDNDRGRADSGNDNARDNTNTSGSSGNDNARDNTNTSGSSGNDNARDNTNRSGSSGNDNARDNTNRSGSSGSSGNDNARDNTNRSGSGGNASGSGGNNNGSNNNAIEQQIAVEVGELFRLTTTGANITLAVEDAGGNAVQGALLRLSNDSLRKLFLVRELNEHQLVVRSTTGTRRVPLTGRGSGIEWELESEGTREVTLNIQGGLVPDHLSANIAVRLHLVTVSGTRLSSTARTANIALRSGRGSVTFVLQEADTRLSFSGGCYRWVVESLSSNRVMFGDEFGNRCR